MKRVSACGAAALLCIALLAGCSEGKKVAVRINKDVVTEDEFNQRAQNVNVQELMTSARNGGAVKAGDLAMQSLIQEKLILQLAAEKGASPTDAQVNAYLDYVKNFPNLAGPMAQDTLRSDAEKRRDARVQVAVRNMVIKPLNITTADLQKIYDAQKSAIELPEQYHLRLIDVGTPQKAQQALAALNKNVPFETVALKMSDNPETRQKGGDIGFVPANNPNLAPLLPALKDLKPLAYTPKAAELTVTGPNGTPMPRYVIAQLVEKKPGRLPSLEEVRPYLENIAIVQKDQTAFQRMQALLREKMQKADLQVNLKEYEGLVKRLKDTAGAPSPSPAPQG